jgi:glucose-6-phosphate 1-epimerase
MTLDQVRTRFACGSVKFLEAQGGLPCLQVRTAAAAADVYLYGAHLSHFQPAGEKPLLFMSGQSAFEPGKPLRGGVPICFPWFGPKPGDATAPLHGFARTQMWELESVEESGESVELVLALQSSDATRRWYPHDFLLRHRIRVGRELETALITRNTGREPMLVQEALHTYFTVGDVRQVRISGLERIGYIDKVQAGKACPPSGSPITITAETDRVYNATASTVIIDDPSLSRRISIAKTGSNTTVVWNPWIAKSAAMPDFGNDEWPQMLCVETANAGSDALTLAAGAEHTMQAKLSVASW